MTIAGLWAGWLLASACGALPGAQPSGSGDGEIEAAPPTEIPAAVDATASPTTATTGAPTTTTTVPTTTTTTVPWLVGDERAAQVEELMAATESLRGRAFLSRPAVETITADEYHRLFPAPVEGPCGEVIGCSGAFLELLGLVPEGGAPVPEPAGEDARMPEPAYDSARSRIVLPDGEGPLDEYERWALVGVLVRALTHQHNPALVESALGGADSATDRVAAHRALLEGESLLIQSLYLGGLAPERMADLADQAMARAGADAHQAGAMVREVARFPLAAGSFLAVDLYRLGGPAALDQAMDMPPETTEQVLHIDRYRHLEPAVEVEPVRVVADGFLVAEEGVWGERRWRGLLGHHGEAMIAAEAADGWGGDRYRILWNPEAGDVVFVARYVADSFADESGMNAAIRHLVTHGMAVGSSRVVGTVTEWEGDDYAMLSWDVDLITFLAASDPEVGRRIAAQLGVGL